MAHLSQERHFGLHLSHFDAGGFANANKCTKLRGKERVETQEVLKFFLNEVVRLGNFLKHDSESSWHVPCHKFRFHLFSTRGASISISTMPKPYQRPKLRTKRKIVISLHGIRTRGVWQKDLSPLITEQGWIYYPLDFGWFSVLFFIPGFIRRRKIEWFRERYKEVRSRYPDVVPTIIAHSFGTWILCNAIAKYEHLKFDKIILCGAIVKSEFDWENIYNRNQIAAVRNDCAKKDVWARFSKFFAWGTGNAGYAGFRQTKEYILDKVYDLFDHGSAFGYDHYLGEWIPYIAQPFPLCDGNVPWDSEEPISPYDAARWSAITYFSQYLLRVVDAIQRKEVIQGEGKQADVRQMVVLIPRTPGEASQLATNRYYTERSFTRVLIGSLSPRTGHLGPEDQIYDIPTTIHSLLDLDHRTDEDLVDAVNEFAAMLQRKIDAPASGVKGVITIKRI